MKSMSTHVLDTATGRPAQGIALVLERAFDDGHREIFRGETNSDGRSALVEAGALEKGVYRLTFDTGRYFAANAGKGFYPKVQIDFEVDDASQHYHVPLLVSPYGFSTYRGS